MISNGKNKSPFVCYTANVAKEEVFFLPSVIVYGSIIYPSSIIYPILTKIRATTCYIIKILFKERLNTGLVLTRQIWRHRKAKANIIKRLHDSPLTKQKQI